MKIGILHLSDIHIQEGRNPILKRREKIFEAVKNNFKGVNTFLMITTGDIAYSGKEKEYEIAGKDLYNFLYKKIRAYIKKVGFLYFIPGNHDCDFSQSTKTRELWLKEFSINGFESIDSENLNECCKPLANYFSFVSKIEKKYTGDYIYESPLLNIVSLKVGKYIVKLNLFNTAWHSQLHEEIGKMGFPIQFISDQIPSSSNNVSISLLHHPFNWQKPEQSKEFRRFILKTSDIVLSGHEHTSDQGIFSDFAKDFETIHFESSALQDSSNENNSAFNYVELNLATNEIKLVPYSYNWKNGRYIASQELVKKIEKTKKLKAEPFEIKKDFLEFIESPGANFVHSTGEEIKLDDIYVSPIFADVGTTKEKTSKLLEFVASSEALALNESDDTFYKVIFGNDSSGKTTVLKHLFKKYYNQGLFPVYIQGEAINSINSDKLKSFVLQNFEKQYNELEGKFESISYEKIVLLIDDFHKLKVTKSKPYLVSNLASLFNKIIITGNELLQFDSYTDNKTEKQFEIFDKFDRYLIKELGPTLRHQIINKWYRLGKDYLENGEKNEFYKKIDDAANTISTIIGKNLIPAYPIFILSILQTFESGQTDTSNNNLHSYYYEHLIRNSLKVTIDDKEDIGYYLNLSKEYCFFLFKEKIRLAPITKEDFFSFLNHYAQKYILDYVNNDKILDTFIRAKILSKDRDQNICIKHKYIYYYFVAKYLADNIEEEEIRNIIGQMSDRVYRDEYSNILIFLTYLSKNSFVIDKLIEKSREIFMDCEILKLEEDISVINELHKTIPEQVIHDLDVESARKEELEHQEEFEAKEKLVEEEMNEVEDYDLTEDTSDIDSLARLTKALRTLNIVGNIARKNWGEMLGNKKYALAEETFCLGLRTLSNYFTLLNNSQEGLIDHIKSIIHRKFMDDKLAAIEKSSIEKIASSLIFNLSTISTFGIVKRVANSIGTQKLSKVFEGIEENHPHNSIKIINAAIKLDHYSAFPMRDIEALAKENEKNPLAFSILQNLVIDHLYMYEVSHGLKQKIYNKLNIKLKAQRYIEASSPIKKSSHKYSKVKT